MRDYYTHVRQDILEFFPADVESTLDIGCGIGATSRYLKEHYSVKTAEGLEVVESAAHVAVEFLDKVYMTNIESIESFPSFFGKKYDVILFLDVLEHLLNPEKVLKSSSQILKDSGHLIISLPNIRHYSALFPLFFRGKWEYKDEGILDRTHFRFFTLSSMKAFITEAGYEIVKIKSHRSLSKMFFLANILLFGTLTRFSDLQYIFLCRKRNIN